VESSDTQMYLEKVHDVMTLLDHKRLSPRARFDIYLMYLDGVPIKDICTRFGIAPQRAKAVVWNNQYYFECVRRD
jgi:hypothetical protein